MQHSVVSLIEATSLKPSFSVLIDNSYYNYYYIEPLQKNIIQQFDCMKTAWNFLKGIVCYNIVINIIIIIHYHVYFGFSF